MENRRAFLRRTFAVAGVAALPGAALAASASRAGDGPWWLVAPVGPGGEVGHGWHLARLFPPQEGAVTLNLLHVDGRTARVDLCLHDGHPRGPAHTEFIDFIVMDGGDGAAPMDESLGRAVRRLAAWVSENESQDLATLTRLQAHAERVEQHPLVMAVASRRLAPGTA